MSKLSSIFGAAAIAGAAISLMPVLALSAPFPDSSGSFPLLSGAYLFTIVHICQPKETVTYNSQGLVKNIVLSNANDEVDAGKMTFKQGHTSGSGTVTLNITSANGSPFLVKNSGESGQSGNTMDKNTGTGSAAFKQTSSVVTITESSGSSTYNVYYGKVSGGVVQHAVFGGLDNKSCATEGSLTII